MDHYTILQHNTTQQPVVDTEKALAYREHILRSLPAGSAFEPLMTLYLTDVTTPDEIQAL